MSITIIQSLPEKEWRRFVDKHPQSNIFHTPDMFDVFAQAKGYEPSLWAAVNDRGSTLALFTPVRVTLMDKMLSRFTTRSIAYGSVLGNPNSDGQEALTKLLRTYEHKAREVSLFTELRNLSDLGKVQPFLQGSGFVYEEHLNYLVDLTRSPEEIWSSLDSNVRTNVRKARRMGVVVQELISPDQVPAAYAVLAQVYENIHVPLAHLSLFEAAFEILYPLGMIKILTACVQETCIGVAVRLLYKGTIHAWYAGADREYASYKANDLLNWHILEWGSQNGFTRFDFGGAGKPDQDYGPRKFKAKFNGTLVNYGRNVCVHHPYRLRLSQWGYEMYRRTRIARVLARI